MPKKIYYALKLVDMSISMRQIARVFGIYYNKIQKLSKAKDRKVDSLTYVGKETISVPFIATFISVPKFLSNML